MTTLPFYDPVLVTLHVTCQKHAVAYKLSYNEHNDTWYVAIESPSPTERYVSRDYSDLRDAAELAIKHLEKTP